MFGSSASALLALHVSARQQPFASYRWSDVPAWIDGDAAAARSSLRLALFGCACWRRTLRQPLDRVFSRPLTVRSLPACQLSAPDRRGAANHSSFTVREAVSVIQLWRSRSQQRFRQAAQRFWWHFSADFHRESISDMAASLSYSCCTSGADSFTGSVVTLPPLLWPGANAQDIALTLGDGDGFTRVQQVEAVGGFSECAFGRQAAAAGSPGVQQLLGFFYCSKQENRKVLHVGVFELAGGSRSTCCPDGTHVAVGRFPAAAVASRPDRKRCRRLGCTSPDVPDRR